MLSVSNLNYEFFGVLLGPQCLQIACLDRIFDTVNTDKMFEITKNIRILFIGLHNIKNAE